MLKKGLPIVFMSAFVLGACSMGNDQDLPKDNETPMEDFDERERNWAPDAQDERRGGTDLDGIETDDGDDQLNNNDPLEDKDAPRDNEKGDRNSTNP